MTLKTIAGLLIAASLLAASTAIPAQAATLEESAGPGSSSRAGAFAGARIRLALGGRTVAPRERLRAGLTVAPLRQSFSARGRQHVFYGEGLELGFARGAPIGFSLAGRPVSTLPEGPRRGIGTLGKVAIGLGVAAVVTLVVAYAVTQDALNDPQD